VANYFGQNQMNIQQALGDQYCMFFCPDYHANKLTPVQTLAKSVSFVNQTLRALGPQLSKWDSGQQDEIARLVRVNWIYQRLCIEPIRKPILVHMVNTDLVIDCGDTRIMALTAWDPQATVPVLVSCDRTQADVFAEWRQITCDQDLIDVLKFDPASVSIYLSAAPPGAHHAVDWLEIGDLSTSHHLHHLSQRLSMMQEFLNTQTSDFEFDLTWPKQKVNWHALYHTV
jgi:hypothetical protein